MRKTFLIPALILSLLMLPGCYKTQEQKAIQEAEKAMEQAGEQMEKAMKDAEDALEDATGAVEDAAMEAKDAAEGAAMDIKEGTEDAMEEVKDAVEEAADSMTTPAEEENEDGLSAEALLAKCLTEKGAKLYTASWCGHCKNQKAAFGDGLEYLDNTECAADNGWAEECSLAGVKAVPTWIFSDGEQKTGNTPLPTLADLSGCTYTT